MIIQENMELAKKLSILGDAAKFDVSCSSSGADKKNNGEGIGNSKACGICHSFSADGRCISLLKILFTNECIFNCRYCINRSSNDVVRTSFTPEEVCTLTVEFYRRNYIEGLFLSSGIVHSPDYTMSKLVETVHLLRTKYHFGGYIHLKGIPGASYDLIEAAGWYADRMSVNLELPTGEGLKSLAPNKSRKAILTPMRSIQNGIYKSRGEARISSRQQDSDNAAPASSRFSVSDTSGSVRSDIGGSIRSDTRGGFSVYDTDGSVRSGTMPYGSRGSASLPASRSNSRSKKLFVPAGQSTQMIIGATPESDYHIMTVAEALYDRYDLKRVYYSAFVNVNHDDSLPVQSGKRDVPLLREHRLYQADWLMRFYGFKSQELLSEERPNFNVLLDPKCDWALRHLERFPVEINRADYYTLLRVPGIGVNSAKRIVKARRQAKLDFSDIKKMGVVLKRALYFITCQGKMMYNTPIDENYITAGLIGNDWKKTYDISHHDSYRQLSLFDDFNVSADTAVSVIKAEQSAAYQSNSLILL